MASDALVNKAQELARDAQSLSLDLADLAREAGEAAARTGGPGCKRFGICRRPQFEELAAVQGHPVALGVRELTDVPERPDRGLRQ